MINIKKIEFYENKNIIYSQLRKIRKHCGISQSDLAIKMQLQNINMDQQMISKIENNNRIVTDYELACLCSILQVEPKELLKDYYIMVKNI